MVLQVVIKTVCVITGVKSEAGTDMDLNIKEEEDIEIKEEPLEVKQEVEECGGTARQEVLPCCHAPHTVPEDRKHLPQVEVRTSLTLTKLFLPSTITTILTLI